jgi:hypothetical protein
MELEQLWKEISGFHSGQYKDDSLLGDYTSP